MCKPTGDVWRGRGPYRLMSPRISTGVSGKCVHAMGGRTIGTLSPSISTAVSGKCVHAMYGVGEGWTIPHDVTTYFNGSFW